MKRPTGIGATEGICTACFSRLLSGMDRLACNSDLRDDARACPSEYQPVSMRTLMDFSLGTLELMQQRPQPSTWR